MIDAHTEITRYKVDFKEGQVPFAKVPFTVVKLPRTAYDVKENPKVWYDYYYLRTGNDVGEAIGKAAIEFLNYGYEEKRFNHRVVIRTF